MTRASAVTRLLTLAAVAATGLAITSAHAETRHRQYGTYVGSGPNYSYQSGPHTRVYVTKRSFLDGGTEVLPGDRKFTDYAYPPGITFARENLNRPIDRQPLNPPEDFGSATSFRLPAEWNNPF